MSKKYFVAIEVVYSDEVYASSEEDAINKVIRNCPYDIDSGVEPCVEEVQE